MTVIMGVGQAGCNIAGEIAEIPNAMDFLDIYLANSTVRDLVPIDAVPRERWLGINETEGILYLGGTEAEQEREVTGGMGKDPRRCYESLHEVYKSILSNLEATHVDGHDFRDERFALLAFSGGGGTGAGAAPVIAEALRDLSGGDCRVVGLMILPEKARGEDLSSGARREAWNAWYSFQRSMEVFDGLILVDNDRLSHLGDIERGFPTFNEYVAHCVTDLVLGNLAELVLPEAEDELILQQTDVQDLVTALSLGKPGEREPGVAAIGRSAELLKSPIGYFLPFLSPDQPDLVSLSLLAQERMTLDVDGTAEGIKGFLQVRAPEEVMTRPGTSQELSEVLSHAADQAQREEVIYGTALSDRPLAAVTMALTYDPDDLTRLQELEEEAERYEWDGDPDDLPTEEDDEPE